MKYLDLIGYTNLQQYKAIRSAFTRFPSQNYTSTKERDQNAFPSYGPQNLNTRLTTLISLTINASQTGLITRQHAERGKGERQNWRRPRQRGTTDSRFTLRSLEMAYAQNDERTRVFLLNSLCVLDSDEVARPT